MASASVAGTGTLAGPWRGDVLAGVLQAAHEVHATLGPGFLELAYQRALAFELDHLRIPYAQEAQLDLHYKGHSLGVPFRADFVCPDLLIETKAIPFLGPRERNQLRHYLNLAGGGRGLLLNFGRPTLEWDAVVVAREVPRRAEASGGV